MISPERFTRMENSATTADSLYGPIVTADATIHVKGAWTPLIAATSFDAYLAGLVFARPTLANMLVDIGVDPAGGTSYTVIIPNILISGAFTNQGTNYLFPVFISKGSQVAARTQASVTVNTVRVGLSLIGGGHDPGIHRGAIQDYGANTVNSQGVALANAAAGTKGAWTQLGADTTRRHSGLILAVGCQVASAGAIANIIDVGIDPAGGTSYTVVLADIAVRTNTAEDVFYDDPLLGLVGIDIPSGSAIAARSAASAGAAGNDDVAVVAYGF